MVFCGKPSKACKRCRDRKLKCDLGSASCGQCVRAQVICAGYRDTLALRIRDESQAVRIKALSKRAFLASPPASSQPTYLAPSLEVQAREAFFVFYTKTSSSWDFLTQFYHPTHTPPHLAFSIDAVSLAYLSHQVQSEASLRPAREKYISALQMTNKALHSPNLVGKDSTLISSLLLDLYEKITNTQNRYEKPWISHINGAFALVRIRDLERFQDPSTLRILMRLCTNFLISSVASDRSVPDELVELRTYAQESLNITDPKWRLSGLMVTYANLHSEIRHGISHSNCINDSIELDAKLQALALDMPQNWQYKTAIVKQDSDRIYNFRVDSYPHRHITQTWNVLRLVRVLLNETVLDLCQKSFEDCRSTNRSLIRIARKTIETLTDEICASVPQYVDCYFGADRSLSTTSELSGSIYASHPHSPSHNMDCYTLIFPLYVAARSNSSSAKLKAWVIQQLHYMASHFNIRNAEAVAQILENGAVINPWAVYAILGSYAFVA